MRAKFSELTYDAGQQKSCCASKGCGQVEPWLTAERIPVKGAYTAEDLEGMEHLNYAAGIAPFLRGQSKHEMLTWLHGIMELEVVNQGYNSSYIEIPSKIRAFSNRQENVMFL